MFNTIAAVKGLEGLYYLNRENRIASFYLEDHDGENHMANYTDILIGKASDSYVLIQVSNAYIQQSQS